MPAATSTAPAKRVFVTCSCAITAASPDAITTLVSRTADTLAAGASRSAKRTRM